MAERDDAVSAARRELADIEAEGVHHAAEIGRLTIFLKEYNWHDPALGGVVKHMARWIDHESSDVRREVVVGLCYLIPPIEGMERLALRGWIRSPFDELHWYASAITCCYCRPEMITPEIVRPILHTLTSSAPVRVEFSGELDYLGALDDYEIACKQAARVINHFVDVLTGRHRDIRAVPDTRFHWTNVAEVIRHLAKMSDAGD